MLKRFDNSLIIKPIRGNDQGYVININGVVKNKFMDNLETTIDKDGNKCVSLTYLNKPGVYRIVDLMATHFKFMDRFTDEQLQQVIGFFVDGDKTNLFAENIGYRFKNGKLEVSGHTGFYYIPGYVNYSINGRGQLLHNGTGAFLTWSITKGYEKKNVTGGYYVYSYRLSGKSKTISRHRSLMMVFSDYPNNCDFLVVNHKDGVPGHDDLNNLEWVCRKGNLNHAYASGLRSQNKPVLARNIFTGEVTEYYSVEECGRQLDIKGQTINFRLEKCKFSSMCRQGYQFKYADDSRDWIIPEDPEKTLQEAIQSVKVKFRDCETLKEQTCKSIGMASILTGVNNSTIGFRLNNGLKGPSFGFQFIYEDDDFPNFTREEFDKSLRPSSLKIYAQNVLTGEEREFNSVNQARQALGEFIQQSLKKKSQTVHESGWRVKSPDEDWIEIKDVDEVVKKATLSITARRVSDGQIFTASSSKEIGKLLGVGAQLARKYALTRNDWVYKGYQFKLGTSW